jgi:hypothetical protein
MYRYAWLEFDGGLWHLVEDLCASPGKSTRRWSDRESALAELMGEGWSVVRPYASKHAMGEISTEVTGYGLVRQSRRSDARVASIWQNIPFLVGVQSGQMEQ